MNGPRRVAILSQFWSDRGGTEVLARQLADGLVRAGDAVELLFLDVANRSTVDRPGMPGTVVPLVVWQQALDALSRWGADELVVLLDLRSGLIDGVGAYSGPFRTTLLVNVNKADLDAVCIDTGLTALCRRLVQRYDRVGVFFESSPAARLLREWDVPFRLARIGIPPVAPVRPQAFRQRHGLAPTDSVLLCVGLIAPLKFQVEMLRLLPEVPGRRLVFIGDIYTGTPDYGLAFGDAILARRDCLWLDGLPRHDVLEAMSGSDLLLFPSQSEGAGLVLLEAMAVGLPWVCTPAVDLAPELDGGVLTTLEAMPATIDALLAAPDRRRALGLAGQSAQRARWTLDGTVATLREWFAQLEDSERAAGPIALRCEDAWPAVLNGDDLFTAAAARAEAAGCQWFVIADGASPLRAAQVMRLEAYLTADHDAVILFRDPQPSMPTDTNVMAWLASGAAVFAIRTAWWRTTPVESVVGAQPRRMWEASVIARLTAAARCYLGSVAGSA